MPAILRETISRWSDHGAARLGVALAFYAILALAPLVIFLVVVVSAIFGATGAEMRIVQDARLFLGKAGANVVSDLLASARNPAQGVIAIGLATLTLLLGASGVFSELRDSLNTVWDVKPPDEGFRSMFARKLFSFVLVLAAGLLVLVSVLATTVVSLIGRFVGALIPVPTPVLEMVNFILSFGVLAVVFALILRYVPDLVLPGKIVCIWTAPQK